MRIISYDRFKHYETFALDQNRYGSINFITGESVFTYTLNYQHKAKKIIAIILLVNLLISLFAVESLAENEQCVFHVDSLSGTRWADYICVYQVSRHSAE